MWHIVHIEQNGNIYHGTHVPFTRIVVVLLLSSPASLFTLSTSVVLRVLDSPTLLLSYQYGIAISIRTSNPELTGLIRFTAS